jgi:hypothetical protein
MAKTPRRIRRLIEEISTALGVEVCFVRYTKSSHVILGAGGKNFVVSGTPSCNRAPKKIVSLMRRELNLQ